MYCICSIEWSSLLRIWGWVSQRVLENWDGENAEETNALTIRICTGRLFIIWNLEGRMERRVVNRKEGIGSWTLQVGICVYCVVFEQRLRWSLEEETPPGSSHPGFKQKDHFLFTTRSILNILRSLFLYVYYFRLYIVQMLVQIYAF